MKPPGFIRLLFENTRREAERVCGMTFGPVDEQTRGEVDEVIEGVVDHADHVLDMLDDSNSTTFDVLSVTLATNYALVINRIRRIRANRGDELPESVMESLNTLIQHLQNVDVGRQYFKSVYLQEELSSLSRVLLYAGVPAELLAVLVLLGFTAARETVLLRYVHLFVPVFVTVAFLPLALLVSFIVRTATVTQRTVATTPFTTSRQEQ